MERIAPLTGINNCPPRYYPDVPDISEIADGWQVWNNEPRGHVILAYRPDIFDTNEFPPACLPTITIGPGSEPNQPRDHRNATTAWYVVLYLEPRVRVATKDTTVPSRPQAIDYAVALSHEFTDGKIDFDAAYIDPRPNYLAKLKELTTPVTP